MELTARLNEALSSAIAAAFPGANTDPVLRRSDRSDFQANAPLSLKKQLNNLAPRDIAAAIVAKIDAKDLIESVEVSGPGFLNVTVTRTAIESALTNLAADANGGVPKSEKPDTVIIDYSSPNVAKELHVGHLRSTVIGDAVARVLEATGHRVIRQNHLGDWGTPFGMLIEHLIDLGKGDPEAPLTIEDLDGFYRAARAKFDSDEVFQTRSRTRVVALQGGDELSLALWRKLCAESRRYFQVVYDRLGIKLTDADVAGESSYGAVLPEIVETLRKAGLAQENDGALCVFPPGFTNKDGSPLPLIIQKSDGGFGYATTDLAAIRHRIVDLAGTRLVYVVGAPQSQHLAMIFGTAKLAGWLAPPVRAEHVAFGSVLGPDRKMFKTRAGETVKLAALIDEAEERALAVVGEKSPHLDAETQRKNALAIGVGAIKYADLSSERIKDYVFDWTRMLANEGNTGPYIMYACARSRSIARKNHEAGHLDDAGPILIGEPVERKLALDLLGFAAAVKEVETTLEPHRLCTFLYSTATSFSTFFAQCPVLKAPTDEVRRSRLALSNLSASVLARGLDLLGIQSLDRM